MRPAHIINSYTKLISSSKSSNGGKPNKNTAETTIIKQMQSGISETTSQLKVANIVVKRAIQLRSAGHARKIKKKKRMKLRAMPKQQIKEEPYPTSL